MILVYCDTGAYDRRLAPLETNERIRVHQFKYENRNSRIGRGAIPADLKYDDTPSYTYDDWRNDAFLRSISSSDPRFSLSKFDDLLALVGHDNRVDAQHLASAHITGCTVFLTSDRDHIWSNRERIYDLTGMQVFHFPTEWEAFERYVSSAG